MLAVCFLIIIVVSVLDLWMKNQVEKKMKYGEEFPIQQGRLLVRRVHNEGMALNLGDKYPNIVKWLSLIVTCIVTIYMCCLFGRKKNSLEKISLSFLIGGSISNLYDRIRRKYVVDYIGFRSKWKKFENITFNMGDFSIFAGVIGVVLSYLKK
ncbi:signal peptidase II [Faecalimonas sp.]